ncbi:MAG: zinc-binding dehydrogenase [Armatimonadota bacterium]
MRTTAVVIVEPGRVELAELDVPALEDGAVLLEVMLTEVCGTDVHLLHGRLPGAPYPLIPGHFAVGRVADLRGRPTYASGGLVRVGDAVTFLDVYGTCGQCWFCQVAHATTRCPSRRVYGITIGAADGPCGAWSRLMYLKPGTKIVPLEDVPAEQFIGGGCGLATALHVAERADIRIGDTVVVQGSGPVGLNAVVTARLKGATDVILVGAPRNRLDAGKRLGADHVIDISSTTPSERLAAVRDLTDGRGADVVIEATGSPSALAEGLEMTRDAGTYVVAGQYTDAGDVTINPHSMVNRKHITVKAVWGIDFGHLYRSLRVLRRYGDSMRWEELLTKTYTLEQAATALSDVEAGNVVKAAMRP